MEIYSLLASLIRVGKVTAKDEKNHRVQVTCSDTVTAPYVSDFLQVLVPRAFQDQVYDLPDIGDQVLCIFLPNGKERGFVVGSMYVSSPPVQSGEKVCRTFADGSFMEYDRATHKLVLDIKGDLTIKASGIVRINAAAIRMQE